MILGDVEVQLGGVEAQLGRVKPLLGSEEVQLGRAKSLLGPDEVQLRDGSVLLGCAKVSLNHDKSELVHEDKPLALSLLLTPFCGSAAQSFLFVEHQPWRDS